MKGMCKDCPDRATCKELCPRALAYAEQDYVARAEPPIGLAKWGSLVKPKDVKGLSPRERQRHIIELHLDGKTDEAIAWHMECSRPYVDKVLRKFGYRKNKK